MEKARKKSECAITRFLVKYNVTTQPVEKLTPQPLSFGEKIEGSKTLNIPFPPLFVREGDKGGE
ncbi:MAG: hypothetical protein GY797_18975 [Deltaproteobacteria bacterium]|nr:hypothetical protein [Deltaproteobacteria bacterium]